MNGLHFTLSADPDPALLKKLGNKLAGFNDSDTGPAERQPLAILVQSGDGTLKAGLSGFTGWGWLYIQWLWVDETMRGQGLAGELLKRAEAEARKRKCHGAHIDTFNPVALKLYERAGYEVFGALEDFPRGRTRSFLAKRLDTE